MSESRDEHLRDAQMHHTQRHDAPMRDPQVSDAQKTSEQSAREIAPTYAQRNGVTRADFLKTVGLAIPFGSLASFSAHVNVGDRKTSTETAQPQQPRVKKRVLAWADTRNGIAQHDSVSHAISVIERLGYESNTYDTYIRTDSNIISKKPLMTNGKPASGGPSLNSVDAIFFLGHRDIELADDQKADLLSFVKDDGKGFVAAHTATTALQTWPEFGELIGGRYDGHPWGSAAGTLINEDPSFPATKHFPATFPFTDEFYQTMDYSREKMRVVLRLDVSKMPPNTGVHRTDGDFPLAWAKMYGKGRVFYSSLGHSAATWDNPDVSKMYFEAIKWSLGLTPGDATPRPYTK